MTELSITRAGASARYALPSDRHYLTVRHVWAQMHDGVATVGVTAPLGEMLWFTPEVSFWAVERVDQGQTLATVQGRSGRTVIAHSSHTGSSAPAGAAGRSANAAARTGPRRVIGPSYPTQG